MKLKKYLEKVGDEAAAKRFGVTVRTIRSWRLGQRYPHVKQAATIVRKSEVTYEGIYSLK